MKSEKYYFWNSFVILVLMLLFLAGKVGREVRTFHFNQKFSLFGAAVKLDKSLIAGVDKIIRGEEAEKIIQDITNGTPLIDKNLEFLVFRIKVLNQSKKVVEPLGINVELVETDTSYYGNALKPIKLDHIEDHDLLFKTDYKKFNANSTFEPGETKYGTYLFISNKGSILNKYYITWGKPYQEQIESVKLSPSKLHLFDPAGYIYQYFTLLSLLVILFSFIQRKRKKKEGYIKSLFMFDFYFYVIVVSIIFLAVLAITNGEFWYPIANFKYPLALLAFMLLTVIYYLYASRRFVILFSFLREQDVAYIQEEFIKRMGWTNVKIEKGKEHVEVTNQDTWETYHFHRYYVVKEDVKDSLTQAKETLWEIYLSLPIEHYQILQNVADALAIASFILLFFIK